MIQLQLVYVDALFTCGECGFIFWESWFYSQEWVWNLETKKDVALLQGNEMSAG